MTRSQDGKLMALRPPKSQFDKLERFASSSFRMSCEPETTSHRGLVNLDVLFDLGLGNYVVSAACKLPGAGKKATVAVPSNEIRISIIAK